MSWNHHTCCGTIAHERQSKAIKSSENEVDHASTTYGPLAYNNPLLAGGALVAAGAWVELVEVVVGQVSEVQAEDELDCCQSPQA